MGRAKPFQKDSNLKSSPQSNPTTPIQLYGTLVSCIFRDYNGQKCCTLTLALILRHISKLRDYCLCASAKTNIFFEQKKRGIFYIFQSRLHLINKHIVMVL